MTASQIADIAWGEYLKAASSAKNVSTLMEAWDRYQQTLVSNGIIITLSGYQFKK